MAAEMSGVALDLVAVAAAAASGDYGGDPAKLSGGLAEVAGRRG